MKKERGLFIAIEGLDGSGKTALANDLGAHFSCRLEFEPTNGKIGSLIRSALQDLPYNTHAFALLFALDRERHSKKIKKALEYTNIICDRYLLSSLAYQGLEIPKEEILRINSGILFPDITIFLDAPPELCLERIEASGKKKDAFENLVFLKKLKNSYGSAINFAKERALFDTHIIDATKSIKDCRSETLKIIRSYF